jgi:hypothetical protein
MLYLQSNAKKSRQEVFDCSVQLPVFRLWLVADYNCILGCVAECKKSEKFSVLEKSHLKPVHFVLDVSGAND